MWLENVFDVKYSRIYEIIIRPCVVSPLSSQLPFKASFAVCVLGLYSIFWSAGLGKQTTSRQSILNKITIQQELKEKPLIWRKKKTKNRSFGASGISGQGVLRPMELKKKTFQYKRGLFTFVCIFKMYFFTIKKNKIRIQHGALCQRVHFKIYNWFEKIKWKYNLKHSK